MSDGDDAVPRPDDPTPADPAANLPGELEEFDPDELGPSPPEPPEPDAAGNTEATKLFWRLVVVFDLAILGIALGPMFAYFEGRVQLGLQLFAGGAIVFAYGVLQYYRFRRDDDEDDSADEGDAEQNG